MLGQTLGHYRLVEKIGAGGMGVVYKARDERLDRDVAVKVLPAGALADEEARTRFRKEALALSRLNHPNVATIHDFNTEGGVDFLAMEYISGVTLAEMRPAGGMPEPEIVRLGRQAAEALEAAHDQGLIHRDLKPGNIMVTPKGLVKLLDFGLAKLLRPLGPADKTQTFAASESFSGTLAYMAPEQLEGRPADQRTDIHALGIILYELATGQKLFSQEAPSRIVEAILHRKPEIPAALEPGLSEGLGRIILKCLEKNPADRYASARELIADLERFERGDLAGMIAGQPSRGSARGLWRRPAPLAAASALILAALSFVLNVGGLRGLVTGRATASGVQSLAVLPLKSLSQDPAQDWFAEGITDSLITELGQVGSLRVISSTSIGRYIKTDQTLPQIAKELAVGLIVEGSVQRAGDRVKISAKLIRPSDERQLWGKSFERNVGDVLALQSEIAGDIAREIGVRLSEEANLQLAKRRTVDPRALDAYLKGVYSGDMENFAQAVKIDPDFAPAYTKMASGYFYSGLFGDIPPREAFSKMKEAALKALEKDDTLGEAHGFLAVAYLHHDLNWAEAEKEFKRAFVLNPSLAQIHHLYAHYLMAMNRIDESLSEVRLAEALDPFSWDKSQCFGWHCLFAKGYDDAVMMALDGVRANPKNAWAHVILGWAYEQKSMLPEAITELRAALDVWKDTSLPMAGLAHAYAAAGQTKEAGEILAKLLDMSKRTYVPAYDIAVVYEGLGDDAKTFAWLDKACEERSGFLVYIKCDRRFDRIRSDPRFESLIQKVGLPLDAI
ncbi:MAG: Adenylate cyclase [Candidatus Aminicenantes bacterium]|nr:Adenylate cyclase [Candidatus Aminicenantes bacterium]